MRTSPDEIDSVTAAVVDAAVKLHMRVGPGLLESVYESLLTKDLVSKGFIVERQKLCGFIIDGQFFEDGLRVDMLVNGTVVVELKSIEKLAPVHAKQLLSYLRLLRLQVGLLINFGGATLKEGLQRVVNQYTPSATSQFSATLREP